MDPSQLANQAPAVPPVFGFFLEGRAHWEAGFKIGAASMEMPHVARINALTEAIQKAHDKLERAERSLQSARAEEAHVRVTLDQGKQGVANLKATLAADRAAAAEARRVRVNEMIAIRQTIKAPRK